MSKYYAAVAVLLALQGSANGQGNAGAAHVRTEFRFTVDLPYEETFPLFGGWGERKWAPDWKPKFLYPDPPADQEGAVFLVEQGPSHVGVWMTTKFDSATGQIQHVFVLNQAVITRIGIEVKRDGKDRSEVSVAYERTAIDPGVNEHVRAMAKHDAGAAAEWKAALAAYAERLSPK